MKAMRPFVSRERIRNRLLRGVYEQNLAILGIKTSSPRRRRFPMRQGVVSAVFLGVILLGQAVPLSPVPWGAAFFSQDLAASSPPPSRAEPGQPVASSEAVVSLQSLEEQAQAASSEEQVGSGGEPTGVADGSDAVEYRSLAKDGHLRIRKVFGLGVKTIMIDPGHGGESATGAIGRGGTEEKTVNLDIAKKLKAALERDTGYRILMTREEDRDVSLKRRVEMANEAKADLFISIHVNALPSKPIDIVETYYFGPARDKETLELAAEVNEGSDYSYSEYNEVIKEIANQLKYQESSRLARSIQDTLYQGLKRRKADVYDFGVKRAPFVVLLGVEMPAVLVEVACLSNAEEEQRLKDAAYRETLAGYLERGIIRYLGGNKKRSGLS